MPDFAPPVAQDVNVNPLQGIQTLSGLIGLKQQQQQLQTQTAQAQQAQQQNSELQQAQGLLQQVHNGGYRDKNGNLDSQRLATDLASIGPYAGAAAQNVIGIGNDIVTNQKALQELTEETRGQIGGLLSSAATNPSITKRQLSDSVVQWIADHGDDPNAVRVGQGVVHTLDNLQDGPQLRAAVGNIGSEMTRAPQSMPSSVNTGTSVQPGATNQFTGAFTPSGGAIPVRNVQPLGNGQIAVLDPTTGTYRIVDQRGGNGSAAAGAGPPTSANDPARPEPNAPSSLWDAYGKSVTQAQGAVYAAQQADANYGTDMETANMIRQYSNQANTGPGTSAWVRFTGALGSRIGSQNVANYQTLASFLDLQSSRLRDSMNLPATNAGMATSQEMGTSIESQRNAIQAKTDYYQALTQLNHQYRLGLDSVGGNGVNPSPTAVKNYQRRFAESADPINTEIELATQRGDTVAVNRIVSSLSPQQRQQLITKRKTFSQLVNANGAPNG